MKTEFKIISPPTSISRGAQKVQLHDPPLQTSGPPHSDFARDPRTPDGDTIIAIITIPMERNLESILGSLFVACDAKCRYLCYWQHLRKLHSQTQFIMWSYDLSPIHFALLITSVMFVY